MKTSIFSLLLFCVLSLSVSAQITIGSDTDPQDATLLDIKTNEVEYFDPQSATTDKEGGGILLPRLALTGKNNFPFIVGNTSGDIIKKLRHKGLLVYNLNKSIADLKAGVCVWDGTEWKNISHMELPTAPLWLLGGNAGTNPTTNYLGTQENTPLSFRTNMSDRLYITGTGLVGIGSKSPLTTLHIAGDMRIGVTPIINRAEVLGVDAGSKVGKVQLPVIQAKYVYAQSNAYQWPNKTSLNNGDNIVITWGSSEIKINTVDGKQLMTFNPSGNTFTFKEKALCEFNGFVNYVPFGPTNQFEGDRNKNVVALEVAIQQQVGSSWVDLTKGIGVWEWSSVRNICESVLTPYSVKEFNAGDVIRMVIRRPSATFGLPHNDPATIVDPPDPITGKSAEAYINKPTGSNFSKGLKVRQILDR
ncbi:hypothetical protein [Prevotella sp. 10(H)]|uniref:hypothetical protein n=1 Tax=Prevotella sp. 10(H) TaxID=1158294 RepID=UPI0004A776F6|nr:hypothetical protein [Prevotella sp. 10(H)]